MDFVWIVLGVAAGFGLSFWAGFRYGEKCRTLPESRYWAANAIGMVLGFVLASLGAQFGLLWLWIGALGIMAGSVSGLKYGLGKSVGIWRLIDGGKRDPKE